MTNRQGDEMSLGLLRLPLFSFGLVALLVFSFTALQHARALRGGWPPEADTLYLPSARTLHFASLRHDELAADLVSARTNVYFGTQMLTAGRQRWLERYIHTAIELDPWFHRLYLAGAAMFVYNGKALTMDMLLAANDILARGSQRFPYDWELLFQRGFNLMFELPQIAGEGDARTPKWRQEGIELLRNAALFENVPYWLPTLVGRLLTKRGSDELAIKHLEQAYAVAATEEARVQIRNHLVALRGQQYSQQLEEERRHFEELVSNRYPYAPDAFSVITGPRHPRAITTVPSSAK